MMLLLVTPIIRRHQHFLLLISDKTLKKIQVNENGTTHITLTPRQHHPTQQQQQHAHAQQDIHHHDRTSNSHSANNNRVRFQGKRFSSDNDDFRAIQMFRVTIQ